MLHDIYIYIYIRVYICICICICVYVYMCVCMYVCMDGWMDGWMHACMHGCMDAWMHGCMDACMHVCMHACMDVCLSVCLCVCVCFNTSAKHKWSSPSSTLYHSSKRRHLFSQAVQGCPTAATARDPRIGSKDFSHYDYFFGWYKYEQAPRFACSSLKTLWIAGNSSSGRGRARPFHKLS